MKKCILFLCASLLLITACNNKTAESTDKKEMTAASSSDQAAKNKQTALSSIMAANSHDPEAVLKDASTDATDYGDGTMDPVKKIDSIKAVLHAWFTAFPDVKGENFMALSSDDGKTVAVVTDWTGTFKGELMGMKPTGKGYKVTDVDILTFNDEGKIIAHRSIVPNMAVMMQVGAEMPK